MERETGDAGTPPLDLVKQRATLAPSVVHRADVIQDGRVVLEGPSARVASDPEGTRAYLGGAGTSHS